MERIFICYFNVLGHPVANHIIPFLRNLCLCGDIHQAVFGITVESIVFDTCFTVPCDGHQVGVGIESKGFNGDYSTAYAYRTQIFTITESIEPYGFYFVGDDDVLYLCAFIERILSDGFQIVPETDAP